jgi:hypothetical protein
MEGMIDAQACYGTAVKVCFTVVPKNPVTLVTNGIIINTDSTTVCDQNNDKASAYCVYAGASFVLANNNIIIAHGSKPLVLLSTTTMTLQGDVDVSSRHDGPPGAGASSAAACAHPEIVEAIGTSGGYGGSFGGRGGEGEQVSGAEELRGSPAPAISFPNSLRGGCPGGAGAMGNGAAGEGLGGAGGAGGGAVALVATTLTLDGQINASGAGGRGGPTSAKSGGGGGGAGGMIVLDSLMPIMTTNRTSVFANGGGGGQGGEFPGKGGGDGGESLAPTLPGTGGANSVTNAGKGGLGSSGSALEGGRAPSDARSGGGGGAGGGGGGFVHAPGVTPTVVAPPSLDVPQ